MTTAPNSVFLLMVNGCIETVDVMIFEFLKNHNLNRKYFIFSFQSLMKYS